MVVRLRLARHGTKNNPFYHVVAIRDKASRDAKPIEKLGEYDPIPRPPSAAIATRPSSIASTSSQRVLSSGINDGKVQMEKRIEWNAERIQYWLSEGAQPSKPVARLLDKAGLIPEGKTYKGIYRPADQPDTPSTKAKAKVSPSAILRAAGVPKSASKDSLSGSDAAATALRQGEVIGQPSKTNPKQEASKSGAGEATIDQAS